MNLIECSRCHKLCSVPVNWDDSLCKCKPFKVFGEEFDENGEVFYGRDFKSIVETIAENRNIDDPVFDEDLFKKPITVIDENGIKKKFNCYASISIDYFAEEVKGD